MFIDAVSYFLAGLCLYTIKKPEGAPISKNSKLNLANEITIGVKFVFGNRCINALMGESATYNLFSQILMSVFLLHCANELHLSAGMIGLIFSMGGIGSIIGSLLAEKVSKRTGIGPATIWSMILACGVLVLVPIAEEFPDNMIGFIFTGFFLNGIGLSLSNITATSIRQSVIPEYMLARALSASRLITWGATPIGALTGGLLGEMIGLRETMFIGGIGLFLAPLWVIFSPLRKMKGTILRIRISF
ncbi:hypothetical protein CVD28_12400 [Bacillus sp. M6-12]|nr:hypothetical protein CVD28_12400 [Bacillus sp. M6-12]